MCVCSLEFLQQCDCSHSYRCGNILSVDIASLDAVVLLVLHCKGLCTPGQNFSYLRNRV